MVVKAEAEQRVIVGVRHEPENTLPAIKLLERFSFSSLGIELTPSNDIRGYEERGFFGEIAATFHARGVRIVPLESAQLRERVKRLIKNQNGADAVYRLTQEAMELGVSLSDKAHERISSVLKRGRESQSEEFEVHTQTSRHMLEVIRREDVPVAIIGTYHAGEVIAELPNYKYVTLKRE